MSTVVALIDSPAPNLLTLSTIVQKCVGRNPLTSVDNSPRMLTTAAKALAAYNALKNPVARSAVDLIRNSESVQAFLNYTFLCASHYEVQMEAICLNTGLNFVTAATYTDAALFLVGGNLSVWRDAITVGSRAEVTRELFNKLYIEFERAGLSEVWAQYERPAVKGGFLIERRK